MRRALGARGLGRGSPARVPRTAHASLSLPAEGGTLVVVADTHSAPHPGSEVHLRSHAPVAVLHAGDIGDLAVLDALSAIAPVHAVRGNIDEHAPDLPEQLVLDVSLGDGPRLRLFLVHIAFDGPRLRGDVERRAVAERADVVIAGHSHVPFVGRQGELVLFNPGSVGPRRFQLPIVYGAIELSAATGARLRHFEAATGAPFDPRAAREALLAR